MSLVEQELLTLPKHMSSPSVFGGVHVIRSLVLCVCFCRSSFVLLFFFSVGHCDVCPSFIYVFWLPLWYLQTLLNEYRIMSVMKVEKDINSSIKGNPIGRAVILVIIYFETFKADVIVCFGNVIKCWTWHWPTIVSIMSSPW